MLTPDSYAAWYNTPRGKWIGEREFKIAQDMIHTKAGLSLLDVGCGTGYFSNQFSKIGLNITAVDPDKMMVDYAQKKTDNIHYLISRGENLPFSNNSFDYSIAITSLCFTQKPSQVLSEMWRVSRKGVFLGLLNRYSLLYIKNHMKTGYHGARWDSWHDIKLWINKLEPQPLKVIHKTVINFPTGGIIARLMEKSIPDGFYFGGFIAVYIKK